MGDAPERIWLLPFDGEQRAWCNEPDPAGAGHEEEADEYLRADIAAAREAELRAEVERVRANRRETFEAMVAMRDTINEAVPIPSLESDLSRGPDDAIFCEVVATAVVTEAARLRAEVNTLATENADYVRELFAVSSERDRHCAEADRLRALLDEARPVLEEAAAVAYRAFVGAHMEAANAGPTHPLKNQMDAWRARCLNADQRARATLAKIGGQHE